MQTIVMSALIGLALIAMACFLLLIVLYNRNERKQRLRLEQTKADIADMALLFETMRSVITQQKALAKEFNQELEKKVSQVKQVLAQSMAKNERLYEQQQDLAKQLLESKTDLQRLQRQITHIQERPIPVSPQAPVLDPPTSVPPKAGPPPAPRQEEEPPVKTPVPPPAPATVSLPSAFADWGGFELAETPEPVALEVKPEKISEPKEDSETARAAFRALLDLIPANQPSVTAPPPSEPPSGDGKMTRSLQQRVIEYSEAGMSIPDIARELGVGKGEVRLMLSLARQKRI